MIEWMDRRLQKELLDLMAKSYPDSMILREYDMGAEEKRSVIQNLSYLHGIGLCKLYRPEGIGEDTMIAQLRPIITSSGLDLLQDDGGLRAIFDVVTVRFEADTLRAIIAAKIDESSESEEKKSEAKSRVGRLEEEGLKQLLKKAMGEGLSSLPHVADWVISSN